MSVVNMSFGFKLTNVRAPTCNSAVNHAAHFCLPVLCVELVYASVPIRLVASIVHDSTRCSLAFFKTVLRVKIVANFVSNGKPRFVNNIIQI